MSQRSKAVFFLAAAAVLWSTGGVLIKWVDWNPVAIAGARSIISAGVIWAFFRKEKLNFSKTQWAGAAAYCGMVTMFVTATKLTTAANAILLQYTAPVYVALLGGLLLAEKTTRRDWITMAFVFGGMIFFFIEKVTAGGMIGNLCAVISGVSFAVFVICMRLQKNQAPYGSVLLGNILTFLISLPFWQGNTLTLPNVAAISLLGIFQLGVAYVLYSYAIRHVKALEATLITTIEPILNPVWVFIFLGEVPGKFALIGGFVVMGAIVSRYLYDQAATSTEETANKMS